MEEAVNKKQNPIFPPSVLLPFMATGAILAWLYLPHMISMVNIWWIDPNYSHGLLVPAVSAWLIWRRRRVLGRLSAGPNWWGLVVMGFGLLFLLIGQLGHEYFLRRVSLIPVLWGLTLLNWGWPVAQRVIFPFAYLLLMIPLPYNLYDSVAFPLRLIAASLAGWVLSLLGVPVLVEGNILHLPNTVMNVVDACSGIRSLISLLAAGVLLAYLILPNRWTKPTVVILVAPVAVFANAVRVAAAGLLAEYFGQAALKGAMHDFVGWLVFIFAFLILAGSTWLLRAASKKRDKAHEA